MPRHRRNPPPVHTLPDEMLATDGYAPQVGDIHEFAGNARMDPSSVVVTGLKGGKVAMALVFQGEPLEKALERNYPLAVMPVESAAHFVNDLRGFVYGPPSDDPAVDAVLSGEAEFLGKGDDGLAFRAGDVVVKVSTTVPFQPFNPGHKSPEESIERMVEQHRVSEAMRDDGIPGILPSRLVIHGDKAFMVKPFVEIPERLSRAQLDEVARSVEAAHDAGWVFLDAIQVGTWDGEVYHFDIGKAARSTTHDTRDDWQSEENHDVASLKRLFKDHGQKYLTASEKIDPTGEWDELLWGGDPENATPEERQARRSAIFMMSNVVKKFVTNYPDHPSAALWSDPAFLKEQTSLGLRRWGLKKDS